MNSRKQSIKKNEGGLKEKVPLMPKTVKLCADDHILRYAAWNRCQKDSNGVPLRLEPQAFDLRPRDRGHLSVTWVEHFAGNFSHQIEAAVKAFRQSMQKPLPVTAKGAFGKAIIADLEQAYSMHEPNKKVRVIHAPGPKNTGHSQIRNFRDQNAHLLNHLASQVFSDIILNNSIPP